MKNPIDLLRNITYSDYDEKEFEIVKKQFLECIDHDPLYTNSNYQYAHYLNTMEKYEEAVRILKSIPETDDLYLNSRLDILEILF